MWMALALIQAAAAPLPAGVEEDLNCLAVLSFAVHEAPADEKPGLIAGLMYYIGRIDHAAPGFDYAAQLDRLSDATDFDARMKAAAPRCGRKLEEVGGSMQRWGEALQQKDRK